MWDKEAALEYLRSNVHRDAKGDSTSIGRCAEHVRLAVEAGGVKLLRQNSAKDYGSSLAIVGFLLLNGTPDYFLSGDIAIIQPITGHPHGHICMYDGDIWISDFEQKNGYYPGSAYRKAAPSVAFYRYAVQIVAPPPFVNTTFYV